MRQISLLHGPFPILVVVLTVAVLGVTVVRRRPRWGRRVALAAVGAAGVMATAAWLVSRLRVFDFTYPRSFYLWLGVVLFALGLAGAGWRGASGWRRAGALGAVALSLTMALTLINLHYGYFPTAATVLGEVANDQASVGTFRRETHRARATAPVRSPASRPWRQKLAAVRPTRARSHGMVIPVDFPAPVSHFDHRPGYAYLPPAWFDNPRPSLPVLLMLTGTPSLTSDWTRAGLADRTADGYAALHGGYAPIMLFPDDNGSQFGDTECVDSPLGHVETYLTVDVPTYAAAAFGADVWHMAVAGLSEGGTCALELSLRHPDLFPTFADFSGGTGPMLGDRANTISVLFGGDTAAFEAHDPLSILARKHFSGMAGWFEAGTSDHKGSWAAARLASAARGAGIDSALVLKDGTHNFIFWSRALGDAFPWLGARLGITRFSAPQPHRYLAGPAR